MMTATPIAETHNIVCQSAIFPPEIPAYCPSSSGGGLSYRVITWSWPL